MDWGLSLSFDLRLAFQKRKRDGFSIESVNAFSFTALCAGGPDQIPLFCLADSLFDFSYQPGFQIRRVVSGGASFSSRAPFIWKSSSMGITGSNLSDFFLEPSNPRFIFNRFLFSDVVYS